jgi:choline dehydrogenase-like flavoprotein
VGRANFGMIRNAREIEAGKTLDGDICIVGAGAAGITLARELSGSRFSVILLESGGLDFDEEVQALYQAEQNNPVYNDPETSRLRFFGGATNHWAGTCSPLDAMDFEVRPWLAHSGWPFSRADLDPFYEKAHLYCQLGPFNYDPDYWSKFRGHPALPLAPENIVTRMSQSSPPTRFGETYRSDLGNSQNIAVYLNANLIDIDLHTDGMHVETALASTFGGKQFRVRARTFVLAMGGIENARMLLNCDKVHKGGIGNQHDLVGRYFMDHPVVSAATFVMADPETDRELYIKPKPDSGPGGTSYAAHGFLSLSDAALKAHGLNNIRAPILPISRYAASDGVNSMHIMMDAFGRGEIPGDLGTHVGNVAGDLSMVIEGISRRTFNTRLFDSANDMHFLYSDIMIEQRPEPGNRISLLMARDRLGLRKAAIEWKLADADKENLWRCVDLLAREFGRSGVGRVKLEGERGGRTFGDLLSLGDHHMGTTRASANPRHGVVDGNLRVHGVANLYIAGSSVFPTGGHVPPTLTIVALAIRMAGHLRQIMES